MSRPTQRRPSALLLAALLAALPTAAIAGQPQQPKQPAAQGDTSAGKRQQAPNKPPGPKNRKTRTFTAPDGSRFVLVQDDQQRQLHWALACWTDGRDDPPGFAGLTSAAVEVSLNGTWTTGSADADAERAALRALDQSWQVKMVDPNNAENNATLLARDQAAADLGDPRTFRRVLAATPAFRPEIVHRDGVAVLVLTTIEPALPAVARLLVERREQQALRGLARAWLPDVMARAQQHALHPERRIHAELLALTMPLSPAIAGLEPPPMTAPKRADALASWQRSQHPTRTAHVLYGAFDLDRAERVLKEAFAATALPQPVQRPAAPPRPLGAQRRSIVPGMPTDSVSLAWLLPTDVDPWTLRVAGHWLAGDGRGTIRHTLRKKRPDLQVEVVAPWPTAGNPALLRIDVRDPGRIEGLAADVLDACRQAAALELANGSYHRANTTAQREWTRATSDTRALTTRLAERVLARPGLPVSPKMPPMQKGAEIRRVLAATFASQPAIVEGHR
ncbi:MAG: insulinase family protein [Planctomycetota bacterium]